MALIPIAFMALVMIGSGCQPSIPAEVSSHGHEDDASTPGLVPVPGIADQASREPEMPAKPKPPNLCLSPFEALDSVLKTAPDATIVRHLSGALAVNFIARFNSMTGQSIGGDEVMVINSANYGDTAVAVFAANHCVVRTLAFQPATPNHPQE